MLDLQNNDPATDSTADAAGLAQPIHIALQPASIDIWDSKYRLKSKKGDIIDQTIDDTFQRVARALSEQEEPQHQDYWCEQFLWALRRGAIPAGRITSNAGALANNASNGIEPSFAHHYSRNVIREGKKTKEKVEVFSFELLAYRTFVNPNAMPNSTDPQHQLPDCFVSADDITPKEHIDVQAAAQKWVDSSISKTANVPTDIPFDDFKGIYLYAAEKGLKGCTTFRFNPAAFQGVLVKDQDLARTTYRFELEDGTVVEAKGNEQIEYDGEIHSAANLFDALKEGMYGRY